MTKLRVNVAGNVYDEVDIPSSLNNGGDKLFRILSHNGDDRIVWDKNDLDQIIDAHRLFDELVNKGLEPYAIREDGQKDIIKMSEFDPSVEEIVFLPTKMLVGG